MSRDDLTKAWREEAELYAYLGYVSPRNQPAPPKPAGSVLPEKPKRFSKDRETLAKVRDVCESAVTRSETSFSRQFGGAPFPAMVSAQDILDILNEGDNQ